METKTEYKIVTLDDLKFEARGRENARKAQAQQAESAQRDLNESKVRMLTDLLNRTAPYSEFFERGVVTVGYPEREPHNYDVQIIVRFVLPEHAEILARFVFESADRQDPGRWEHKGFMSNKDYGWTDDPAQMWRVSEWNGTKYDPEAETYYAAYRSWDFKDLGDALLHAERAWRDPDDIQREVDDHNRKAALTSQTPDAHTAPEPTPAEILLNALNSYIDKRVAAVFASDVDDENPYLLSGPELSRAVARRVQGGKR